MPNNESYITISGWMVNELKLKGNELLLYALIYGFSQDGETEFNGSITYMQNWLGCSRNTVINIITSLIDKGLIDKKQVVVNGVTVNRYTAKRGSAKIAPPVQKLTKGSAKIALGVVQKLDGGSAKIAPNNTKYNTNNNTKYNNARARESKKPPNLFNNFEQREYDFNVLTDQLMKIHGTQ